MADAVYTNTSSALDATQAIIQKKYWPNLVEHAHYHGMVTQRLIQPKVVMVDNEGLTFQNETGNLDSIRSSNDINADWSEPTTIETQELTARLNLNTPADNDFTVMQGSLRVHHLDLKATPKGIFNLAKRLVKKYRAEYRHKLAINRYSGREANIGKINSNFAAKNNNRESYASAEAYTDGSKGLRLKIKDSSIANFQRNSQLRLYSVTDSAYIDAQGTPETGSNALLTVKDKNPLDLSVGVKGTASLLDKIDAAMTGGEELRFYFGQVIDDDAASPGTVGDERNIGMYSMGEWFNEPTEGESWIGGVDRTNEDNRWLLPLVLNRGEPLRQLAVGDLGALATAMSFQAEETQIVSVIGTPDHVETLKTDIGDSYLIPWPHKNEKLERFAHIGMMGVVFQHPQFGIVTMHADTMCDPNMVFVIVPDDWASLHHGWKNPEFISETSSIWSRVASRTGRGKSKAFQADAYNMLMDFCFDPDRQGAVSQVHG